MSATASNPVSATVPRTPNLVLDVKQTAAALSVSVSTVRRFIKRKELPVIRLGRRLVVMHDDVVAFLRKKREEPMD